MPSFVVAATLVLIVVAAALWLTLRVSGSEDIGGNSQPKLEQITAFVDAAVWPAISRDAKILVFIRGPGYFASAGQVYAKMLPDGEPVALTHDEDRKLQTEFSPNGSRVAYTVINQNGSWDTWTAPVSWERPAVVVTEGERADVAWRGPTCVFGDQDRPAHGYRRCVGESHRTREIYDPPTMRGMAHLSRLSPNGKWVALTEMGALGWLPCRAVPADGSSRGRVIPVCRPEIVAARFAMRMQAFGPVFGDQHRGYFRGWRAVFRTYSGRTWQRAQRKSSGRSQL